MLFLTLFWWWLDCLFLLCFQALNLILLTSSELSKLRNLLRGSLVNREGKELLVALYASWCHSPMAIISLCLLSQVITETFICFIFFKYHHPVLNIRKWYYWQAYQHASVVIQSLVEEDMNVKFFVQLDKLIRLLETPIFAYLRLQVCLIYLNPKELSPFYSLFFTLLLKPVLFFQLLEPGRYPWLLKTLYGLLMLLPQVKRTEA